MDRGGGRHADVRGHLAVRASLDVGQLDRRPDAALDRRVEAVGEDRHDRREADRRQGGAGEPDLGKARGDERRPDEAADEAARDAGERHDGKRLADQDTWPGVGHPDVRPAELGGETDRSDQDARHGAEEIGALAGRDREGHRLHQETLGEIEGEVLGDLTEQRAHDQRQAAVNDEEQADREERGAPARVDPRRDQGDPGGERDQHGPEEETELGGAEVELGLEVDRSTRRPPQTAT
ncbi:MAG TPA: hypothetical protein VKB17_09355 [Thermoleophilaceae bacterium]|nr:hypothetical protein [Thermoleophilaceae bacterium]